MAWIIIGIVVMLLGLFALVDRLTDSPMQRRRVNSGTDRYRASMDWLRSTSHSIFDIRVGSGDRYDPTAKQPDSKPPPDDSKSSI